MARMLTLEGAPRTPKKEEEPKQAAPAKSKPPAGPRMGPGTRPSMTAVEEQIMAAAGRMGLGQVSPNGSTVAEESLRRIRALQEAHFRNRAAIRDANRPTADTAHRVRRPDALGHLFDPAPAAKPSVTVLEALRFLAQKNSGELLSVVKDMASRNIVSAKQHAYAKSICLKPHNRAALNAVYDLRALNAEGYSPSLGPATEVATVTDTAQLARFPCSITGRRDDTVTIDFMYRLSTRDGKGKVSVRSLTVPNTAARFSGSNVIINAGWLRARGVEANRINNVTYE